MIADHLHMQAAKYWAGRIISQPDVVSATVQGQWQWDCHAGGVSVPLAA